jgi:hypothetical protein
MNIKQIANITSFLAGTETFNPTTSSLFEKITTAVESNAPLTAQMHLNTLVEQEDIDLESLCEGTLDEKYNGWSNKETWAANLWLTNDEPAYRASSKAKNASQVEKVFLQIFGKDGGPDKIDLKKVDWDEVYKGLNESLDEQAGGRANRMADYLAGGSDDDDSIDGGDGDATPGGGGLDLPPASDYGTGGGSDGGVDVGGSTEVGGGVTFWGGDNLYKLDVTIGNHTFSGSFSGGGTGGGGSGGYVELGAPNPNPYLPPNPNIPHDWNRKPTPIGDTTRLGYRYTGQF